MVWWFFKKKKQDKKMNCGGGGPPFPALLSSQSDFVLSNGLAPSCGITVPPLTIFNGPIPSSLISPDDLFPTNCFPGDLIPTVTREVSFLDLLLAAVVETTNNFNHVPDKK